jgi:uncharacterized membrane protein YedE/YeeE
VVVIAEVTAEVTAMAPLAKQGIISTGVNMWAAALIGVVFGVGLQRAGFTDGRKIAAVFYLKDVDVVIVMFSAMVTGMLGLWGLSLLGLLDTSITYFLPTYLAPMAVGGLIFGVGMVTGGYCPGTAVASSATGKIDAMVFIGGFFIGSLLFGDLFPVWGDFYASDYRGVFRIDQWLDINLGSAMLLVVLVAIGGGVGLRRLQWRIWGRSR